MIDYSQKINNDSRGSAIAYGLIIMTAVSIILVSMITFIVSQLKFSANRIEREKAFQIAEAGIYYYRWYLAHATDGMNAQQLKIFWQGGTALGVASNYTADYNDPETGEKIGKYVISVGAPDPDSTIATVISIGSTEKMPEVKRTIKARFRRPSWSEYMYLVNNFVNFGTGAEVYGKIHSNFGVRFDGVAHNSVTSHSPFFNDPSHSGSHNPEFGVHTHVGTRDPVAPSSYPWPNGTVVPNRPDVFQGGRQFPVPEVQFNGVALDLTNMKTEASAGNGRYLARIGSGRRIILKSDGNFDVCTINTNGYNTTTLSVNGTNGYLKTSGIGTCNLCSGACLATYPIPNQGVIFVENNAWVEGTINNKRVTIVAANLTGSGSLADIYVGYSTATTNNIRYTNYDGRDVIGLVGQRNVRIGRDCPNAFTIDAALLAQDITGKVYRSSELSDYNGYNKISLTINGAIASYGQPYFNYGSTGFSTRTYNFDNNLLYYPPPYFPTGTEYSIDLWEEV